jgi:hypothetical protein
MENTKFIKQLKLLKAGEFKRFLSFVQSPYFNTNPKLGILMEQLAWAAPGFQGPLMDKQFLFGIVYGKKEIFDPQKLFNLSSQLQKLLHRFIAEEQFGRNEELQRFQLLEGLDERDWKEPMRQVYQKTLQWQRQKVEMDADFHLSTYRLLDYGERMQKFNRRGTGTDQLLWMQSLDAFYLTSKLRHSCEWLNRQNISRQEGEAQVELLEPLLQYLEEHKEQWAAVPSVLIYFQIMQCLRDPSEEQHFFGLKSLLETHITRFSQSEQARMYAYAQNYCIQKINQGYAAYFEELFQIYERLLENGVLLHEGVLPHEHYKNITTVGLRLQKYEWVKSFLECYRKLLHPNFQENAYTYNLCVYFYEQRRFKDAMKSLRQVQFSDPYYDLSARSILLKIYFEMRDDDSLKYHLQAFQAFLKRNKAISGFHIQSHQNLIRMTKKLVRLRRSKALGSTAFARRLNELEENLSEVKPITNLSWLRQQLGQIA